MKAKKSFGQHFLTSEPIAERIAQSLVQTAAYDQIVEVGPGTGMLTKYLLALDHDLKVVEADRDMVAYLKKHYPELDGRIIEGNFLRVPLDEAMNRKPFAIIGNFPYNISSQILFRMLEYREWVPELVGMFQREMAERVVAPPGSKTYGVISVLVQAYYEGKMLFSVKPGSFNPPPKVHSAVIRLERKTTELDCDYKRLRQVVKMAFGQRRKMLRNTLRGLFKDDPILKDPFFQQRPEQLDLDAFVQLSRWVEERNVIE